MCNLDAVKQALIFHWGVNKANSKTWPVTEHDVRNTEGKSADIECNIPKVSGVVVEGRGRDFQVRWSYARGCIPNLSVDYYRLCWKVDVVLGIDAHECVRHEGDAAQPATYTVSSDITRWRAAILESMEIRPNDILYGGPLGFEGFLGNHFLDDYFQGAYYPKQMLNIRERNTE